MTSVLYADRVPSRRRGILGRDALFRALGEAVMPDSGSSVLVVIGFEGLREFLEAAPVSDADHLLEQLGVRLAGTIGDAGAIYASRRGEFCVLCPGGLAVIRSLLAVLPSELDDVGRQVGVRSSLGITVLPDEATLPTYALALADRRIRALSGEVRAQVK